MSTAVERELAALIVEKQRREREDKLGRYVPYEKQALFHSLGASKRERLFRAGNQQGKTYAGGFEVAMHATGEYPDWWVGKRFDQPITAWVAGVTSETTRDVVQRMLLGPIGEHGTGTIPKKSLVQVINGRGIADAADTVIVRHKSGGNSTISFKSFEKGREKFQGASLEVVWCDEEPSSADIYSECLARISARNGIIMVTATPLLGMSTLMKRFHADLNDDRARVDMTIADALHVPVADRKRIEEGYLPHERDARLRGIPMLGSGRVFELAEELITIAPRAIPDHWQRLCAVDFGTSQDHPFAAVWLTLDRDNDCLYVTDAYMEKSATVAIHCSALRARGAWIPTAYPHDGNVNDRSSGDSIAALYRREGIKMLHEHASFAGGGNSVEAGLLELNNRMLTGRFKVFSNLGDWFDEFRLYHRREGKIVKENDHLLDATRYGLMMLRFSRASGEVHRNRQHHNGPQDWDPFTGRPYDQQPQRNRRDGRRPVQQAEDFSGFS